MTDAFKPDYSPHPGETLRESMDKLGINSVDLAKGTGLSLQTIVRVIEELYPITPGIAMELEKYFNVPASFWIYMQANYDAHTTATKESK